MAAIKGKRTCSRRRPSVRWQLLVPQWFLAHCSFTHCATTCGAGVGMGNGARLSRRLLIILVQLWSSFGSVWYSFWLFPNAFQQWCFKSDLGCTRFSLWHPKPGMLNTSCWNSCCAQVLRGWAAQLFAILQSYPRQHNVLLLSIVTYEVQEVLQKIEKAVGQGLSHLENYFYVIEVLLYFVRVFHN